VVDVVLAMIAVAVLLTVGVVALLGVTAVPFLVALWHAERQRASPVRVGVAAVAGSALSLALAGLVTRTGASPAVAMLPLLLSWVVPVAVTRAPKGVRWLGRVGRHEPAYR
jgi:hypothetical protein